MPEGWEHASFMFLWAVEKHRLVLECFGDSLSMFSTLNWWNLNYIYICLYSLMPQWREWHFSSVVAICWCRGTENSAPLSRWRSCRWFRRGSVAGHFYVFLSRMTSAFKKQRNCCNFLDQKVAWNAYGVQVERLNQLNQFFLHRGLSWFICLPFSPGTAGFNCFKLGKSKGGGSRLIKWGVKVPAALAISGNAVVQRKWREASWAKLESDIISSRLCVDGQWWPMITDIEAVLGSCYIKRLGLCFLPNAVLPWGLRLKIEPWQEGSTFEAIMLCPVQRLQTLQTVLKICKICIFFLD